MSSPEPAGSRVSREVYPIAGTGRGLVVIAVEGSAPGPTVALIGAIHGDETEGPLALTRLLQTLEGRPIAGKLLIAPAANPDALAAMSRCSPSDGKNLARCFPGDFEGSPTEVMAALITREVILKSHYMIDLHSGGTVLDAAFFAGYGATGAAAETSRRMAMAFGAPVVWDHHGTARGRTMSVAHDHGIPAIYVESAGGPYPAEEMISAYHDGVLNVLRELGILSDQASVPPRPRLVGGSGDLDNAVMSEHAGLFEPKVIPLQRVKSGQTCAIVEDLGTGVRTELTAPAAGLVMFVRRARWIETGDLIICLATEHD